MALYAFDGTGQKDDQPELENTGDSNVARFFRAYLPTDLHLPMDDRRNHYQRGIGSDGLFRKALGGITGFGGRTFVKRALHMLEENIEAGDTVVDVVGFSRGARSRSTSSTRSRRARRSSRTVASRLSGFWAFGAVCRPSAFPSRRSTSGGTSSCRPT
jgi:hypothetical protein